MVSLKIVLTIITTLIVKHGVNSCSLRSHTLSHKFSDSIIIPHHSSVQRPHIISPSYSDSSTDSSFSSSDVLPNRLNNIKPATPLSVPTPVAPYSPIVYSNSYNQSLVNILIQLLSSSSVSVPLSTSHASSTISSISPPVVDRVLKPHTVSPPCYSLSSLSYGSNPTSITANKVPDHVSKPNIISSPSGSSSDSSPSSDLSKTPSDSVSPSTVSSVPVSASTFISTTGINRDLVNNLQKICLLILQPTPVSATQPTQLSPLCNSLLMSTINTNSKPVSVSMPNTIYYHSAPSSFDSPRSPDLLCGSLSKLKVPKTDPVPTPKAIQRTDFENSSPRDTVQTKSIAPLEPVRAPTSAISTFSGHNSAIINYLMKLLLCTQAPIIVTSSPPILTLSKLCSLITSKQNTTSDSILKQPETVSSTISTILPQSSSDSLSSTQPNFSEGSSAKLNSVPITPPSIPIKGQTSTSSISSGYNPAFIKLLIKHLVSTQTSLTPHLSSLSKLNQPTIITTTASPIILNPFPTTNFNGLVSDLNPTVSNSNILLNKSSVSVPFSTQAPTTVPNKPFNYNQTLINLLFKVLSNSPNDLKTPLITPASTSSPLGTYDSNNIPSSTLVPKLLPKSDLSTSSSLPVKYSDLSPGSTLTLSDGLFPITDTPSPVLNPIQTQVQNIILPKSSSLSSSLCHRKHSRLSKLSNSHISSPCMRTILRPQAPPLLSPCLKSTLKLSSDCKHHHQINKN